jgi:outer membrane lipoprotein-sorting protein
MFALGEQETLKKFPRIWVALLAILTLPAAGCITIKTRTRVKPEEVPVLLDSNFEDLLARYNNQVRAVRSLQATVDLIPSTGTTYSGVIEEYHDVPGFILAERPATVRVIGQAPVVAKNIFDMVSDGQEFRIYIPSKNAFLVGPTALIRPSKKPLENLRPQHIVEALFWPEFDASSNVLFEQFDFSVSRYYILTLLRQTDAGKFAIARKVWYSRTDLRVSRVQLFGPGGKLDSDITYGDWQPVTASAGAGEASQKPAVTTTPGSSSDQVLFSRDIHIWRPQDDYKLEIKIQKLSMNELITPDKFELAQPAGTDLVRVGDELSGARP